MFKKESFIDSRKRDLFEALLNSLEGELLGEGGKTLEEQWAAFERGDYGRTTLMAVVVSMINAGGKVEHLRGQFPDKLLDFIGKVIRENSGAGLDGDEDHSRENG